MTEMSPKQQAKWNQRMDTLRYTLVPPSPELVDKIRDYANWFPGCADQLADVIIERINNARGAKVKAFYVGHPDDDTEPPWEVKVTTYTIEGAAADDNGNIVVYFDVCRGIITTFDYVYNAKYNGYHLHDRDFWNKVYACQPVKLKDIVAQALHPKNSASILNKTFGPQNPLSAKLPVDLMRMMLNPEPGDKEIEDRKQEYRQKELEYLRRDELRRRTPAPPPPVQTSRRLEAARLWKLEKARRKAARHQFQQAETQRMKEEARRRRPTVDRDIIRQARARVAEQKDAEDMEEADEDAPMQYMEEPGMELDLSNLPGESQEGLE
jgi:hypothetical protein